MVNGPGSLLIRIVVSRVGTGEPDAAGRIVSAGPACILVDDDRKDAEHELCRVQEKITVYSRKIYWY